MFSKVYVNFKIAQLAQYLSIFNVSYIETTVFELPLKWYWSYTLVQNILLQFTEKVFGYAVGLLG